MAEKDTPMTGITVPDGGEVVTVTDDDVDALIDGDVAVGGDDPATTS